METFKKKINFIKFLFSLTHNEFISVLIASGEIDLLPYSNIHLLNQGNFFERFLLITENVKMSLDENIEHLPQLYYGNWFFNLLFLKGVITLNVIFSILFIYSKYLLQVNWLT